MKVLLTADWVNLILVSWKVSPAVLEPHLPDGTRLDNYHGDAFISFVAFEFRNTKVLGLKVPFHVNFPEINLRFYVNAHGKRGVVFIREFVPSPAIALVARWLYNEPYTACPMQAISDVSEESIRVRYALRYKDKQYLMEVIGANAPIIPGTKSLDHFLKEHELGYGRSHAGNTLTYRVEHPEWSTYSIQEYRCDVDFGKVYGSQWSFLSSQEPANVLLAKGSEVKVFKPVGR